MYYFLTLFFSTASDVVERGSSSGVHRSEEGWAIGRGRGEGQELFLWEKTVEYQWMSEEIWAPFLQEAFKACRGVATGYSRVFWMRSLFHQIIIVKISIPVHLVTPVVSGGNKKVFWGRQSLFAALSGIQQKSNRCICRQRSQANYRKSSVCISTNELWYDVRTVNSKQRDWYQWDTITNHDSGLHTWIVSCDSLMQR